MSNNNNNNTLNYPNKWKNILQHKFKNISSDNINNGNLFLRKLESKSFCSDIYESFVKNKNRTLSYIFEFNYNTISISLSIVQVFAFISFFILRGNNDQYIFYIPCIGKKIQKLKENMKNKCPKFYYM